MGYNPNFRGNSTNVSGRRLGTNYQNGGGVPLVQATPVSTNALGQVIPVDVTDETNISRFIGLLAADLPALATGQVVNNGRLENVSIGFSIGDALYVSKAGFLTNIKPDIGSGGFLAGDFVIFVGVVVKNEFNGLQKDIQLMCQLIGEL